MKQFHFYHRETGLLHPKVVVLNVPEYEIAQTLMANAPADHLPIEGALDCECMKVDVGNRQIVDHQPLQPSIEHEWNAERKRWLLSAESAAKQRKRIAAQTRIRQIEQSQARRVREILAENDQRLKTMDQEIAALRADL